MMFTLRIALAFAGLATTTQALVHELVVGNFVNNVLYTLRFNDEIYSLASFRKARQNDILWSRS